MKQHLKRNATHKGYPEMMQLGEMSATTTLSILKKNQEDGYTPDEGCGLLLTAP